VNEIINTFPSAQVILAGDVNQLSSTEIIVRTGLTLNVYEPTRGDNKLDNIYSLDPCYDSVKIVRSVIKSDHKAIVAYTGASKVAYKKTDQNKLPKEVYTTCFLLILHFDNKHGSETSGRCSGCL